MSATLAIQSQDLVLNLRAFLEVLDTARWKAELEAVARERLAILEGDLKTLLELWSGSQETREMLEDKEQPLGTHFKVLSTVLHDSPSSQSPSDSDIQRQWKEFRGRLQRVYEEIVTELRTHDVHVPSLRPTNYARSAFHVISALSTLMLIQYILTPTWMIITAVAFALSGWTMETARRLSASANVLIMKVFNPVAHPHEYHRINSATWYASALVLISLTGSALMCSVAVIVLGLADPTAALIGRRFGKTSLINGRSLEGSLAFVVAGTLGSLAVMRIWHSHLLWTHTLLIALVASVFGAVAELVSSKVDDNMSIPLAAAAGCAVVARLSGIPL
jgi:dolichol kinase